LAYNFDLDLSGYKYSDLKPFIFRDKKVKKGKLNLVLLKGISNGIVTSAFDIKNLPRSIL
jgi:3-dehydroquinate synthetase